MIPEYREDFNARFTPEKYQQFLRTIDERSGAHVDFRCSETACFFPAELLNRMAEAGRDLAWQLVSNPDYLAAADAAIPPAFRVANDTDRPLFLQADFGIIRAADGSYEPRLVEIQGFPSLYGFQLTLAHAYRDVYELDPSLETVLGGLDEAGYNAALREAIVGAYDPQNVVLLEIDPLAQKTLPDFLVTEQICGIRTVDIRDVRRQGDRLYYEREGTLVPIQRIYNRAIADELIRRNIKLPFDLGADLDVEWAGHPNWFFRISKFSLPWLRHPTVPATWLLSEVRELPLPPERLVLKPLFSFAGLGVRVGPTREEIDAVPADQRHEYILQERVNFVPVIHTPPGDAQAEVRVMYLWTGGFERDGLLPVNTIVRTGRGKMMGVDHNKNLEWVGASAGFYPKANSGQLVVG
ncbi:hypothetical protein [Nevskia soli]|uniref:hypothetical protein n=1 Tax=Nevskia soli TaxID=418856 RepID=UPI0015D916A9|nr:hypothetical protein [Nevskia soli]